jgi:hypothetical protein
MKRKIGNIKNKISQCHQLFLQVFVSKKNAHRCKKKGK